MCETIFWVTHTFLQQIEKYRVELESEKKELELAVNQKQFLAKTLEQDQLNFFQEKSHVESELLETQKHLNEMSSRNEVLLREIEDVKNKIKELQGKEKLTVEQQTDDIKCENCVEKDKVIDQAKEVHLKLETDKHKAMELLRTAGNYLKVTYSANLQTFLQVELIFQHDPNQVKLFQFSLGNST